MPEGTTYVSDRKPCGCLKAMACTHKQPATATEMVGTLLAVEPATFDPSKSLREPPQVELTLAERGSHYGDFSDNAELSQALEGCVYTHKGSKNLTPLHMEALKFIFQKISRIVNGDPNYADNWHDIQGYAKLVEDRLPKETK